MTMEEEGAAAVNLAVRAYEKLKEIAPEHELLRFIVEITPNSVKIDKNLLEEFNERFPCKNPNSDVWHPLYAWVRYERALREAIDRERQKKCN